MAGRNSKPVQTPGQALVQTQDNPTSPLAGDASQLDEASQQQGGVLGHPDAASVGVDDSATAVAQNETVTISKDALNMLLARVEAPEAAPVNKVSSSKKSTTDQLPDQDDIDPDTIKQPQLTKQGWVLPTDFGANPNGKKI